MSHSESWPGDEPGASEVESELLDEPVEPVETDEADEADEADEDTGDEPAPLLDDEPEDDEEAGLRLAGHTDGELDVPDDVDLLEGEPRGSKRGVGIVVSRSNVEITNRLLESALAELEQIGVERDQVMVMAVPGAFELPLGAMALAKTRRYACIVALGCVIRGETARFDYISGEAASGLQLAALETGVPVAFGVLTVDTLEQATARVASGAAAVRTALEMADLFQQLRSTAQAAK